MERKFSLAHREPLNNSQHEFAYNAGAAALHRPQPEPLRQVDTTPPRPAHASQEGDATPEPVYAQSAPLVAHACPEGSGFHALLAPEAVPVQHTRSTWHQPWPAAVHDEQVVKRAAGPYCHEEALHAAATPGPAAEPCMQPVYGPAVQYPQVGDDAHVACGRA